MSRYDDDCRAISRIQFHTPGLIQTIRNKLISKIEKRMAREEQLELDGMGTGYYND